MLHLGLRSATASRRHQPLAKRVVLNTLECIGVLYVLRVFGFINTVNGVPHGVTEAIVFVDKLKVEHQGDGPPVFRFCETQRYQVQPDTLSGADGKTYPPVEESYVSAGCSVPAADCYCSARLRVSVNGAVRVNIEKLTPTTAVA